MKYDDLEKTKDLFDIVDEIPSPIEDLETEGVSKNNVAQDPNVNTPTTTEPTAEKPKKKAKTSLKDRWHNLPKKKKTIFIVTGIIIILLLVGLILFLLLNKKEETKPPKENPKTPEVIVEKENYIYKDGSLIFLGLNDQELGTYECKNKNEKACYVVNYNDEDNFDVPKNVYENKKLIERRSAIYSDKYVFLTDSETDTNHIILYNITDKKEEGTYTLVKGFSDTNLVILKDTSNKYGAVEITNAGIVEKMAFNYDYLGIKDKDSKIVAKTNNKYFIYNRSGKLESKGLSSEIKSYNNKYIVVDNEGYYVYDYSSKNINKEAYDFISLLDDYMVLIKDKYLYISDYKGNKYNEEGINIDSTDYNVTNIYNDEKVLQETLKAYEISIEDMGINISYKNKNTEKSRTLSINEGKLSSTISNLNYFDGKLYIYKDEEKQELLGSYTCSNKNNIDNDTKELTNCTIATESFYSMNELETNNSGNLGLVPIFNEKYVFLVDTLDMDNKTIVLYDLENKKILSKYTGVDTGSYTKENKVTFKTIDELNVIAKNKNNKYGVIKITNEVKSVIGFNYSSLEKYGNYYRGETSANTWVLIDMSGKEVTDKFGNKIVGYKDNYVKTTNDNKYYVHKFDGTKVEDTAYLDITLEDDYYIVITTDHKLDIHKYNDQNFKLSTSIEVNSDNYKTDYEVKKENNKYSIKIKSTGKTYTADQNTGLRDDEAANNPLIPTE